MARIWLAALCICACSVSGHSGSGDPGAGGDASGNGAGSLDGGGFDSGVGAGFAIDPTLCGLASGLHAAMIARGAAATQPVDLEAAAESLVTAHYEDVTAVNDNGKRARDLNADGWPEDVAWVIARDARGDIVAVGASGELSVASGCALTNLGVVHRLQDALASALIALGPHAAAGDAAETVRRWAAPQAVLGDGGLRYWRQDIAPPDPNPPQRGGLSFVGTPLALGLAIVGASDPGATVGDIVGVDRFALGGVELISQDKTLVRGPGALRWKLPAALTAGDYELDCDLIISDASLRWQVGTWLPHIEGLFPAAAEQGLSLTLQGLLSGPVLVSKPISALALPQAVTRVLP